MVINLIKVIIKNPTILLEVDATEIEHLVNRCSEYQSILSVNLLEVLCALIECIAENKFKIEPQEILNMIVKSDHEADVHDILNNLLINPMLDCERSEEDINDMIKIVNRKLYRH